MQQIKNLKNIFEKEKFSCPIKESLSEYETDSSEVTENNPKLKMRHQKTQETC